MAKKTRPPKAETKRKSSAEPAKKAARPAKAASSAAKAPAKAKEPAKKKPAPSSKAPATKSKSPAKAAPATKAAKPAKAEAPRKAAPVAKADGKAKSPGAKPASSKPAPGAKKSAAQSKRDAAAEKQRPPQTNLADAKAAALKLAAAAGLRPVQKFTDNGDAPAAEAKRLTKSPLNKRDLDRYRAILVEKRHEVAGDVNEMEKEALAAASSGSLSTMPQHMADQGSDEYDQSLALGLAASQRLLLKEIDDAIDRIEGGTYGVCEVLGVAIHKDRLEATPWARYSLDGARMVDRQTHHAR